MEWRCPTCRAPYRSGTRCYRCQCDLGSLLMILEQAAELRNQAWRLLKRGRTQEALDSIQESLFLHQAPGSENLDALICASQGDFSKLLGLLGPL